MQIILSIIFLNINIDVRNWERTCYRFEGYTYKNTHIVAASNPSLLHLVPT